MLFSIEAVHLSLSFLNAFGRYDALMSVELMEKSGLCTGEVFPAAFNIFSSHLRLLVLFDSAIYYR